MIAQVHSDFSHSSLTPEASVSLYSHCYTKFRFSDRLVRLGCCTGYSDSYSTSCRTLDRFPVMSSRSVWKGIKCNISKYTTTVFNQKSEGICIPIAFADMIGTIARMHGKERNLILSPQSLIDAQADNAVKQEENIRIDFEVFSDIVNFCCDSNFGFESVETYPFVMLKTDGWDSKRYSERTFKRYIVDDIEEYYEQEDIKEVLSKNFRKGKGNTVAKKAHKNPYHHPPEFEGKGNTHALLIVGLNTQHEDDNKDYCLVKNSYGKKWGINGLSKVGVEAFVVVYVPTYNRKRINNLWKQVRRDKGQ